VASLVFFIFEYQAMERDSGLLELIGYIIVTVAMIWVIVTALVNYCKKKERSNNYSQMVKKSLDEYFTKINPIYERRGLKWHVVEGHFWIELRIGN